VNSKLKIILSLAFCVGLGMLISRAGMHFWPSVKQAIFQKAFLYFTSNDTLLGIYYNTEVRSLDWVSLLPQKEQDVFARYQPQEARTVQDLTSQILRSIEASSDINYKEALMSTNTVNLLNSQMISISGFIVPIDFYEDKSIKSLFFVPYFGACIHFPPPPPNQMLFAQLERGFIQFDFTQAYTLTGNINLGLFEDPMGTSAYTLDIVSIAHFFGQPDDFRRH
jgi:hypothetical protein